MILDGENLFSNRQAVTTTAPSANIVSAGLIGSFRGVPMNRDIGPGYPIQVLVCVVEDFAGLTSLKVSIETSDDENFATATTLHETTEIPVAQLVESYQFTLSTLPHGCLQYVRLNYTVDGTGTAGRITAGLLLDRQTAPRW